jgi:hypothetical protein
MPLLLRCPTSRQKPAHRFAESGHENGYIFELFFVFANNPSILGFFAFQYASCDRQTAKIGSLASSVQLKPTGKPTGLQVSEAVENAAFD